MTHPTVTPIRTTWLPTNDAASALGISRRTIQRRAKSGSIKTRPGARGSVEYQVPTHDMTRGVTVSKSPRVTPRVTPDDIGIAAFERLVDKLRADLNESHRARRDAERRTAVAEYRVEIAEVDPSEVEELRNQVATLTAERDEAREHGQRLADAMTKRHGLIKRLTARLGAQP